MNTQLPALTILCFLGMSLTLSMTSCGKKGDLIRPEPAKEQQMLPNEPDDEPKSNQE